MIEVQSNVSGRSCRMSPRDFGKVLHLARFHGWEPERAAENWPSSDWNTEIVLPHIGSYMMGTVSKTDAARLAGALAAMLASESTGLDQTVLFGALALQRLAKDGEFDVRLTEG
jgi:hypothetical protein